MFTTGTPLFVPTIGRWPETLLSTLIGSVCASTGVQIWV